MWQGSQHLHATQKEFLIQNQPMTAVGYILDTEEIVKASSSLFQHDGAAAFKLLRRSPLPTALSAKDLPGGQTQMVNVRRIRRINHHPAESNAGSTPESISDKDWLNFNGNLDIPSDTKEDCTAEDKSGIEPGNGIEDLECPLQGEVSPTPNVPGLIRPTHKAKRLAEKVFVTVNPIETRRNKGVKIKSDRMCQ
jgi:hypothetical protein